MNLLFGCVLVYLLFMVGVSIYMSMKKVKSSDDFAVAGRKLPMIILIGTLLATWCGGGGITGTAGLIYNNGPLFGILVMSGAPLGSSSALLIPEIANAPNIFNIFWLRAVWFNLLSKSTNIDSNGVLIHKIPFRIKKLF